MSTKANIPWTSIQRIASDLLRAAERVERAAFMAESRDGVDLESVKVRLVYISAASLGTLGALGFSESEIDQTLEEIDAQRQRITDQVLEEIAAKGRRAKEEAP